MRRTKIVATLGPATNNRAALSSLMDAGLNVVRLNFSHGSHEDHGRLIALVREIAAEKQRPVAILQDLAGPKIRTGPMAPGTVELVSGEVFTLTGRDVPGDRLETGLTYSELAKHVEPGDTLLLADGTLELKVEETKDLDIRCRVVVGGPLSARKGINAATGSLPVPILTEKDRADLRFGIEQGVDYVAISFVRTAEDVIQVRALTKELGSRIPLIAKIEQSEAVDNLAAIMMVVDGVMVARGDLGVEINLEDVPRVQKRILEHARRTGRPAITATQMLRSMVDNPSPTRAEVSDVANAVLDGTDAVMLSEETAVGKYPTGAVEVLDRAARSAEGIYPFRRPEAVTDGARHSPEEGVARAACSLAQEVGAAAIVVLTTSGSTARQVARWRPEKPVLALTPDSDTCRRLALLWGVVPIEMEPSEDIDELEQQACRLAVASGRVKPGDRIVITAGLPLHEPGTTNLVKVTKA